MKENKAKIIPVYSVNGNILSYCTPKRAAKIVLRGNAKWTGTSAIKLVRSTVEKCKIKKEVIKEAEECYICGEQHEKLTIDHVKPRALGGGDNKENLKPCCAKCNAAKASMLLDEFLEHVLVYRDDFKYIDNRRIIELAKLAI